MKKLSTRTLFALPSSLLAVTALTGFREAIPEDKRQATPPNILVIMVDQMQIPPEGYGPYQGAFQGFKEILGFRPLSPENPYTKYFPGLLRLRQNAVVLQKHYTASAASVPSRACIMTGQYPNVTGVTQTDGLFKSAEDVPFLDPDGTPTIGDWFRAAGYTTHYFGKWHVSEAEPPEYLEPWGFSDWESSYPEPHGGTSSNLGVFRDIVFTENVVDFLNKKGNDTLTTPWLTVASIVNPHDISAWPINWTVPPGNAGVVPWTPFPPIPNIPAPGEKSRSDTVTMILNGDTVTRIFRVDLNPDGFPQNNSALPPSYLENLTRKPQCQQEYALKWGLSWGATIDYNYIQKGLPFRSTQPFQLQGDQASAWSLSYNQFYLYCEYLADLQIRKILQALDSNKLTDNTVIVFLSDHGDMLSSHGGTIQKWHNAYEETIRVPMIISSPLVNPDQQEMRMITQPTSSIDLVPTLLGLAGIQEDQIRSKLEARHGNIQVQPFAGVNLSPYIKGTSQGPIIGNDGNPRTGVLFMGCDMITELGTVNPGNYKKAAYDLFLSRVDSTITLGYPLDTGTVRQPNNPRAFCTGDWKIVQYVDPKGIKQDEWELYCLISDPTEETNLVDFTTGEIRDDVTVPGWTTEELRQKNDSLKAELARAVGMEQFPAYKNEEVLLQNRPNPFTFHTYISLSIPETGPVRLVVTDMMGKIINVVENHILKPGFHQYIFDGSGLPGGVYCVMLEYKNQMQAKKMILIR